MGTADFADFEQIKGVLPHAGRRMEAWKFGGLEGWRSPRGLGPSCRLRRRSGRNPKTARVGTAEWEPQISQIWSRLRACYRTQDCQCVLEISVLTQSANPSTVNFQASSSFILFWRRKVGRGSTACERGWATPHTSNQPIQLISQSAGAPSERLRLCGPHFPRTALVKRVWFGSLVLLVGGDLYHIL